jgi:transposase
VDNPDELVNHQPEKCQHCNTGLALMPSLGYEKRQVFDLPLPEMTVTEHRAHTKRCPLCCERTTAAFPQGVTNWVQYGSVFRAVAVYLLQDQFLPYGRVCEIMAELFCENLSEGTLYSMVSECYDKLAPIEEATKTALTNQTVLHNDETSIKVAGERRWVHVASTPHLTHYAPHPNRGSKATKAIGILPEFKGVSVHDGYKSYWQNDCHHALCNVHHLRELTFVSEQLGQTWAGELKQLLLELKQAAATAREAGLLALPPAQLTQFELNYQKLLYTGLLANPPPPKDPSKRGKPKQSKAKNLLDRLFDGQKQVFAFAYNFKVPFGNNQAERDLRMIKVQQKISGCFRTEAGAQFFCRIRGYLSTMRKQGHSVLAALVHLFQGSPVFPISYT